MIHRFCIRGKEAADLGSSVRASTSPKHVSEARKRKDSGPCSSVCERIDSVVAVFSWNVVVDPDDILVSLDVLPTRQVRSPQGRSRNSQQQHVGRAI